MLAGIRRPTWQAGDTKAAAALALNGGTTDRAPTGLRACNPLLAGPRWRPPRLSARPPASGWRGAHGRFVPGPGVTVGHQTYQETCSSGCGSVTVSVER